MPDDPFPSDPDPQPTLFYVGRDPRGRWVVQDREHLRGGLFVSRAAALKFALSENGNHPLDVVALSEPVDLDFNSRPASYAPSAERKSSFPRAA
jgi:hypothetical protein